MKVGEIIKTAREDLGMTQEDLAENLEVSRQAVSKWELGASVPSAENLKLLEAALGITFPVPEEPVPQTAPKAAFWSWRRAALLALSGLALMALLSIGMYMTLMRERHTDVARPMDPQLTGASFFDENANPIQPDQGDGWLSFNAGERVLMVVEFQNGWEKSVDAVSLFLTPTGTETFDQRKQLGVQAVYDGRGFALFALDIPNGLMGHLDIMLECGSERILADTLKITAAPDSPTPFEAGDGEDAGTLTLSTADITIRVQESNSDLRACGVSAGDVVWSSADPEIAGVSDGGTVWGVSPGVTAVTAEWEGQRAECAVRVVAETGEEVLTIPGEIVLEPEGQFSMAMLGISGAPFEEITWTSSNPNVAAVSDFGAVFAGTPGTAVLTASWNGQSAECTVTVLDTGEAVDR